MSTSEKAPTNIIDFSVVKKFVFNPNKKVTSPGGSQFDEKIVDCTPSTPPWTTFTGILEARRDSPVGKRILAKDPNATEGVYPDRNQAEWVRGIWTAPTEWTQTTL